MKCRLCESDKMRQAAPERFTGYLIDGRWRDGSLWVCDNCYTQKAIRPAATPATPADGGKP